ncbi:MULTISPECIES: S-methyl-5-thioribose-1-phosphate isomerase [Clostridium]|uniref:S-methyl-5-thioribose-1-phosphate isomerase n=1 Tax=Clostridium cadaveris TaxID=1529 RepID=A0A316LZ53_9CLOT|nr:S-methyl-5-thioribose-1-phosphate isomerase [Clostridium cadaveris]MDU4951210.1 S-methyl-5-thioribose-1-phosphate isomerase [Clostridium sp.]MDY4950282.1 S-methyl-5-thioribose-1-phosphate isomerase [Clostridium cadaveris]NME65525.1 S-methyl-5-thioribose-1-phosphate isomerase [Clostridium cadaveris]PWL51582.1 MAG: S-methyl-5-thioribose-1-phosphate isomerase [Clostridium cadaveris]
MKRMDEGLAFLLQYENVAWYEDGKVRILDRRVYPREVRFVTCTTYMEVAYAIRDMVTQSAGPYTAAGMGMALAAHEIEHKTEEEQIKFLEKASYDISHARPTTANRMGIITNNCLEAAKKALSQGKNASEAIFNTTVDSLNRRYSTMEKVGEYLADMFPQNGTIMTQCFGETIIGMMLRAAKKRNNDIKIYCAETRPYLQGARLTASCCSQMGFDTTVITDNMVAYTMQNKNVDLFTSAADTIARDGHIANKIGTLQIAILAKHFGIPYFVTGIPDIGKKSGADIIIEERDPKEVLSSGGFKNTLDTVKGIYPSFDITPPHLISGIVTDKGIFSSYDLQRYFETEVQQFY